MDRVRQWLKLDELLEKERQVGLIKLKIYIFIVLSFDIRKIYLRITFCSNVFSLDLTILLCRYLHNLHIFEIILLSWKEYHAMQPFFLSINARQVLILFLGQWSSGPYTQQFE